jgi:hypothetical protein
VHHAPYVSSRCLTVHVRRDIAADPKKSVVSVRCKLGAHGRRGSRGPDPGFGVIHPVVVVVVVKVYSGEVPLRKRVYPYSTVLLASVVATTEDRRSGPPGFIGSSERLRLDIGITRHTREREHNQY